MSLRPKLMLIFSITIVLAVVAVAWTISRRAERAFQAADQQHTSAVVAQFRREFERRADDVSARIERVAASEPMSRLALEFGRTGDASPYLMEAEALAKDYELDYLEIIAADGSILSSAQWPARFGYRESMPAAHKASFLKKEELADGPLQIGIFADRAVPGVEPAVYVLGGKKLDRSFLANLYSSGDTRVFLYPVLGTSFDPGELIEADGAMDTAGRFQSIIEQSRNSGRETRAVIAVGNRSQDRVDATAIPLSAPDGAVLAVLIIANSQRELVELKHQIRSIAYAVAGLGILIAIVASFWISLRVSRPIEELAAAASEVAAGNWDTRVEVSTRDEVGALAEGFNHMTQQLSDQRERLVQSERVAAWRELARRLAHELKNPLFPLQLTVENLVRARTLPPQEFDEVFSESTRTLSAEIANLKSVVARFSDFSKMPKLQLETVDLNAVLERVTAFYAPVLKERQPAIGFRWKTSDGPLAISADRELMHRALSNLVLNAMDAMPSGGELTLGLERRDDFAVITVSDSGQGMTSEECERLFTPYYTTKQHGTGLGLAIVQSIVSDHKGTITVESAPGRGTTFLIALPAIPVQEAIAR
jgi:signal transduction histidine kinase